MNGGTPLHLVAISPTMRLLGMTTGVGIAGATLVAVVGGQATHGLPADKLFRGVHLGFLAAGMVAAAGAVLSAADALKSFFRKDSFAFRKSDAGRRFMPWSGRPPRNPSLPRSPRPSRKT